MRLPNHGDGCGRRISLTLSPHTAVWRDSVHNVRSQKWRKWDNVQIVQKFSTFVNAYLLRCLSTQLRAMCTLAECVFPFSPLSCTGGGSWAVCDLGTPSPSRALPPSHIKNHLNSRSVQHHVTHFCILYNICTTETILCSTPHQTVMCPCDRCLEKPKMCPPLLSLGPPCLRLSPLCPLMALALLRRRSSRK